MDKKTSIKQYKSLFWLLGICIFIFGVGLVLPWILMDKSNEFGDTAGAINGLFSALAFAGVIFAIFMQRDELEMQRNELSAQKEEFQTQNATLKMQRFENTFFNMLQLQQQITDSITYTYKTVRKANFAEESNGQEGQSTTQTIRGREIFRIAFEEVPHTTSHKTITRGMRGIIEEDGIDGYENNYTAAYFDHYFRHLYRIFKFVHDSPLIEDKERYNYAAMVRALLSRYELIWLYYNGLSIYGKDKLKPLIEDFSLLKNIREDLLIGRMQIENEYDSSAFNHKI